MPAQKARVINLSLGGYPSGLCPSSLDSIFEQGYNAGVAVFVAGGNEYSNDAINPLALCAHAVAAPGGSQSYAESDGVLGAMRNDSTGDDYICDQDIDKCGANPLLSDPDPVYVASQAHTENVNFTLTTVGGSTARPAGDDLANILSPGAFKRLR